MIQDLGDEVGGDFLVEKVGFFGGKGAVIEFLEALDELFVGVEKALKLLGVEYEILIDICDNELFELDVFL